MLIEKQSYPQVKSNINRCTLHRCTFVVATHIDSGIHRIMTSVAKDYLDDIKARKKDLMRQLKELRDLELAIKSAGKSAETAQESAKPEKGPTLKDMVLAVLHALNRGAEATEIADEIKATYSKEVMRSSLSPQLSRLKGEGKLKLEEKTWFLPEHHEKYMEDLRRRQPIRDAEIIDDHARSAMESAAAASAALSISTVEALTPKAVDATIQAIDTSNPWGRKPKHLWRD